jgi:hypothetical protein
MDCDSSLVTTRDTSSPAPCHKEETEAIGIWPNENPLQFSQTITLFLTHGS